MKHEIDSLRQSLRQMPKDQIATILGSLPPQDIEVLTYDWPLFARDKQLAPPGNWRTWVPMAGRGWGKTRCGAEWVRSQVEGETPLAPGRKRRLALIAETASDARDVMVKGDSGILAVSPPDYRPTYIANRRALVWPNGTEALIFSAIEPDQLRGPQFDAAWCDELAKWRYAEYAWDMLQMGLRLGTPANPARALVTTTPRPLKVLKDILKDPSTVSTVSSTYENIGNLDPAFRAYLERRYSGTRLGRQELDAAILDDLPGALWQRDSLDKNRVRVPGNLRRIVVAVDPSGIKQEEDEGDSIGIVVAGLGSDKRGYVLADRTCRGGPTEWAKAAVKAYHEFGADRLVAERNFGGAMVETVIRTVDPDVSYREVTASRGKAARAEPVAALYEQNKVSHVGNFAQLEDQLCLFGPEGYADKGSPDRADALVWAITDLMLTGSEYNLAALAS